MQKASEDHDSCKIDGKRGSGFSLHGESTPNLVKTKSTAAIIA